MLALRGVLGILFGIGAFVWPGLTLAALILVFGAYAFVDGIFTWLREAGRPRLEGVNGMNMAIFLQLAIVGAWAVTTLRHTRRLLRLAHANPAWISQDQTVRPLGNRIWWWLGREEFWRTVQLDALRCVEITLMAFLLAYGL